MALLKLDNIRIDGTTQWHADPHLCSITRLRMVYSD